MRFADILVALDFGESSDRALRFGVELAKEMNARLTVLHVWERPAYAHGTRAMIPGSELLSAAHDAAALRLDTCLAALRRELPGARALLREGEVTEQILVAAETVGAGVIVMGTHGRHGVSRVLLGSVAEKTVRTAPIPVITVPAHPRSNDSHSCEATRQAG